MLTLLPLRSFGTREVAGRHEPGCGGTRSASPAIRGPLSHIGARTGSPTRRSVPGTPVHRGSGGRRESMSERWEAVVVGTGFGGAVAACRLSKRWPNKVLVLERGKRYPMFSFPRSPREMSQNIWNVRERSSRPHKLRQKKDQHGLLTSATSAGSMRCSPRAWVAAHSSTPTSSWSLPSTSSRIPGGLPPAGRQIWIALSRNFGPTRTGDSGPTRR